MMIYSCQGFIAQSVILALLVRLSSAGSSGCGPGEFLFQFNGQCLGCLNCSFYNRREISACSEYADTRCGECFSGFKDIYRYSSNSDIVNPCIEDVVDEIDPPPAEPVQPEPAKATSRSSSTWSLGLGAVVAVVAVPGLVVGIVFVVRKAKRPRDDTAIIAQEETRQAQAQGGDAGRDCGDHTIRIHGNDDLESGQNVRTAFHTVV